MILRIYLAGPGGSILNARQLAEAKISLCARFGLEGVFPADDGHRLAGDARSITLANLQRISSCQEMLANLFLFRGSHADPGTIFDGRACARPCLLVAGYTGVPGPPQGPDSRRLTLGCGRGWARH